MANDGDILRYDGSESAWLETALVGQITEDTTISLTSSQTAAQIQADIDAAPKILNGYTLTFQFADGTYSLSDKLDFNGFMGGMVSISGNTSENAGTLHTNQAVHLNFNNSSSGINVLQSPCIVLVKNMKIFASAEHSECVQFANVLTGYVQGCYLLSDSTSGSRSGVRGNHCGPISVSYTYVSNLNYGIRATLARVLSYYNDDTGTQPVYGLRADLAGTIGKVGTQPSGSSGNESATEGGVIR